jgi:hypothetical protein
MERPVKQLRGIQALGKLERITKQITRLEARAAQDGDTPELREHIADLKREIEDIRRRLT